MKTSEHPGKIAMDKVLFDAATGNATDLTAYSAIVYLHQRLEEVESRLADRNRAFKPPAPEEVAAYAATITFSLDGATFCDYYATRNWCVGKIKMKDWKACVRTWKSRRAQDVPKRGNAAQSQFGDKF